MSSFAAVSKLINDSLRFVPHPSYPCQVCGLPVWVEKPGIGAAFQGKQINGAWLHNDCAATGTTPEAK